MLESLHVFFGLNDAILLSVSVTVSNSVRDSLVVCFIIKEYFLSGTEFGEFTAMLNFLRMV